MPEPVVQQLSEALQQLEAFGVCGRPTDARLPKLPARADDALLEHLAHGLQAVVRIRGQGVEAVSSFYLREAVQELRAAVALLQEWIVRD